MSIMRFSKGKKNPYFLMHNSTVNDSRLSFRAKGLLAYLVSKPDHWYVNLHDLSSCSTDGIYSVKSALKELIKVGYIFKSQLRRTNGQFYYYDYRIYEIPHSYKFNKNNLPPQRDLPLVVKPLAVNRALVITDKEKVLITTTTHQSVDLNLKKPAVVDSVSLNKKTTAISLFNTLHIKSYKKIFKEFPLDKILDYCRWTIDRQSNISNPTGFLITAMRENWIDYDNTPEEERLSLFWVYCFPCRHNHSYYSKKPIYYKCPKCSKIVPKSKHEKI